MMVELYLVVNVPGVQSQDTLKILLGRRALRLIGEQIGTAEVQLLTRHQVSELSQIHEAPNHGRCGWFLLAEIVYYRHLPFTPRPTDIPLRHNTPRIVAIQSVGYAERRIGMKRISTR